MEDELGGLVLLRDGGVLGREGVPVEAEIAHPQLGMEVNLAGKRRKIKVIFDFWKDFYISHTLSSRNLLY